MHVITLHEQTNRTHYEHSGKTDLFLDQLAL